MSFDPTSPPRLASLAQTARRKHLRQARIALIAVGILTVVVNAIGLLFIEQAVDHAIKQEMAKAGPDMVFDQTKIDEVKATAVRAGQLVGGGTIALGVVFIVLGAFVHRIPVVATATGLVLYIGSQVIFAVLDPMTLAQGWIVKIIVIVVLVKALQAAIAYQHEQRATAAPPEYGA